MVAWSNAKQKDVWCASQSHIECVVCDVCTHMPTNECTLYTDFDISEVEQIEMCSVASVEHSPEQPATKHERANAETKKWNERTNERKKWFQNNLNKYTPLP